MTSDRSTVAFIVDQLSAIGDVSAKPMFGEYGLYCDGKMFGMICDGQLFIKPTVGGRTLAADLEEALERVAAALPGGDAETACTEVVAAALKDEPPEDDVALLVIHRHRA